ncbi:MAG: hypothetical protein Q7J07_01475 [Pelolinea sp.]|nr:hypothetical protein [Pelolinea sp.]
MTNLIENYQQIITISFSDVVISIQPRAEIPSIKQSAQLYPRGEAEFSQNVAYVCLDRLRREHQLRGDLAVGQPGAHVSSHLLLTRRERFPTTVRAVHLAAGLDRLIQQDKDHLIRRVSFAGRQILHRTQQIIIQRSRYAVPIRISYRILQLFPESHTVII